MRTQFLKKMSTSRESALFFYLYAFFICLQTPCQRTEVEDYEELHKIRHKPMSPLQKSIRMRLQLQLLNVACTTTDKQHKLLLQNPNETKHIKSVLVCSQTENLRVPRRSRSSAGAAHSGGFSSLLGLLSHWINNLPHSPWPSAASSCYDPSTYGHNHIILQATNLQNATKCCKIMSWCCSIKANMGLLLRH